MASQPYPFITNVVLPAYAKIQKDLKSKGRMVAVTSSADEATIISTYHGHLELKYSVTMSDEASGLYPLVRTGFADPLTGSEHDSQPELFGREGEYMKADEVSEQDIVDSFNDHYRNLRK